MSSARAVYRQYSSSSNLSSSENLPPRTLARLAREVRDLHKNPPEGVRLVIDDETGLPSNLGELMVGKYRCFFIYVGVVSYRIFRCRNAVSLPKSSFRSQPNKNSEVTEQNCILSSFNLLCSRLKWKGPQVLLMRGSIFCSNLFLVKNSQRHLRAVSFWQNFTTPTLIQLLGLFASIH